MKENLLDIGSVGVNPIHTTTLVLILILLFVVDFVSHMLICCILILKFLRATLALKHCGGDHSNNPIKMK